MHRLNLTHRPLLLNLICCVLVLICEVHCGSLQNIRVEITPETGTVFNMTSSGKIERKTFDHQDVKVLKIRIQDQSVPRIAYGSVQHLVRLTTLDMVNCSTEVVEAGAFRNLPQLKSISLIYSQIKAVPVRVFDGFPSLIKIRINNNKISSIEDDAFTDIKTLKLLLVGSNELTTWNPNWIYNLTALEEVDFRYNKIRQLPKHSFATAHNLKKIRLNYNDISLIQPEAFQGLHRLQVLGLTYNRLTTIEPSVFPNHFKIDNLHLDANKLNFLSNEIVDRVSLKKVALDGNPWTCSCLDRFVFRLYQDNATIESVDRCRHSDIPVCVFPDVYSQTCLDIVDEKVRRTYFHKVKLAVDHIGKDFSRCFHLQ